MSINLSAVAVTEFDSMVKHAYANAGLLKNAVTLRNNVGLRERWLAQERCHTP